MVVMVFDVYGAYPAYFRRYARQIVPDNGQPGRQGGFFYVSGKGGYLFQFVFRWGMNALQGFLQYPDLPGQRGDLALQVDVVLFKLRTGVVELISADAKHAGQAKYGGIEKFFEFFYFKTD